MVLTGIVDYANKRPKDDVLIVLIVLIGQPKGLITFSSSNQKKCLLKNNSLEYAIVPKRINIFAPNN